MKPILYYLRRYKTATQLNLLGLSMALAAFYLFMTQVEYNKTFNHSLKDYQRTYRVEQCGSDSKWYPSLPAPLKELWGQIPHVEETTVNKCGAMPLTIKVGENLFQTGLSFMDKNTLDFWGIHLLPGSNSWKEQPDGYIISESLARQIFGTENPVGKKFAIPQWNSEGLTIIGVCQDFAENCSFENGLFQCYQESWFQNMTEWNYEIYLRLDNPENKGQMEKEIRKLYKERFGEDETLQFRLVPMDRAYFEGSSYADKGNESLVYVLQAASIFVLIIGLFNFANFSLAQAPVRMRSINTRKVMGATTASLRLGMILENVLWSVVALTGAALLILLFQKSPECMKLVSGNLSFQTHGKLVGMTLLATLGIGVLSALFSAWYATSFPPALVLKGSFGLSPRGKMLRWTMLTIQFIVAFSLTLYVLVMTGQTHYIFNADYGFNKDEVLYAQLPHEAMSKKDYLRQEITKLPFAENCSFAEPVLGSSDGYMGWGRGSGEHNLSFFALCVDEHFLKTMDIKMVEGRDFNQHDRKGAYILNQAMIQKYPWIKLEQPIGQDIEGWGSEESHYPVVGICENYKLTSMRNDNNTIPAAFIIMSPDMTVNWGDRCKTIFVRIAKGYDKLEAKKQLEQLIKELDTEETCEFRFLDEDLQITYEEEFRFDRRVLSHPVRNGIPEKGNRHPQDHGQHGARSASAFRRTLSDSPVNSLCYRRSYWLPAQYAMAAELRRTYPDTLVVLPADFTVLQSWRVATENPVNSIKTE